MRPCFIDASLEISISIAIGIGFGGKRLFGDTVFGAKAVGEGLAVLVGGVLLEHLARRGALERLEARLALDG